MNGGIFAQPDEKLLYAKVQNQAGFCELRQKCCFTDFIDPLRLSAYSGQIVKEYNVGLFSFGGYENAERRMMGFFPDENISVSDFPIEAIEISYNKQFSSAPSHRDYLGSLIGLGIERTKIGDILIEEAAAIVFVNSGVTDYIIANLETVGRVKVRISRKPLDEAKPKADEENTVKITVPSLRLDALISAAFRISRGKAAELINAEKVFVNWIPAASVSKSVKEGDIITLRGFGRVQLKEVIKETKKGRLAVSLILSGKK